MDFSIPPAAAALLAELRAFIRQELLPREPALLRAGFLASESELDQLRQRARRAGLWGPQIPRELGGLGLSLLDHALVSEQLGYSPFGHYVVGAQAPDAGNIELLHRYGSDEQRARYLLPLAAGQLRSCFSMTEPEHPGSNPTQLSCAARKGADGYIIDGHKWFTSSAEGAAFAIVMAITDPDAEPHRRASMFLVPTDTPGFVHVRNIPIFGHAGGGYDSHAELRYEACRVPLEARIGPEGAGFQIAQERLGPGRIHHCMRWLGICQRAFDLMCERARTRELEPGVPLASKQTIQTWVAESRARIDAARLLVLHTAWLIDQRGFAAAREQVSLIKFHVAELLGQVLDRAIQTHGALGLTDDTVLAFFYTRERGARIYDGPDEVHKAVVARRIFSAAARATRLEGPVR